MAVELVTIIGDIGWIGVRDGNLPFADGQAVDLRAWRIARNHLCFAAAIDEYAGVHRAGENLLDHLIGGGHPANLSSIEPCLDQARQAQVVLVEVTLHGAGAAQHAELCKDGVNRGLDLFIRIEDDGVIGQPSIAHRQAQGQFPAARLVEQVATHPGLQDMQFGRKQRALEAQQQAVVRVTRIIAAILVGDEGVKNRTQLDYPVPIAIQPRDARKFGDQNDANLPQADGGDQCLESQALLAAGPGHPEIIINDADERLRPAHVVGSFSQLVLAPRTLLVMLYLFGGGLANVNHRLLFQVIGLHLAQRVHRPVLSETADVPGSGAVPDRSIDMPSADASRD